jgi:hypothetical protein
MVAAVEQRHRDAPGTGQAARCREPGEAAADDQDALRSFGRQRGSTRLDAGTFAL